MRKAKPGPGRRSAMRIHARALLHNPDLLQQTELTPELEAAMERERVRDEEEKRKYFNKLTTRADVVAVLELYVQEKVVPLAYKLDELEARVTELEAAAQEAR